jgi:hypothetical protein
MPDDLAAFAVSSAALLDGKYVLGDVVGCGGMGIVYSATQVALGRRVAIKLPRAELAANPYVIRRFATEARAGGRLAHRNIARVIDYGGRDGAMFLVMEYASGIPLETLVSQQGPMAAGIAADLIGQILAALAEAHMAGIIHADIKSGNVLVETLLDGSLLARVIDFGLARFCDEPTPHDDRWLSGTPEYLAPEVVTGERPTVASDIYAAGVVLYELLSGMTPFGGGSCKQILSRQLDDVVIPPSLRCPDQAIPAAIEAVVMRALAKDPRVRFATAAQFATTLRAALTVKHTRSARIARRTARPVFSAEASTCEWQRDQVPGPVAAPINKTLRIAQIRIVLGDAIACGNGDSIVTSYLELVRMLVDDHQLASAAGELEHGLGLLGRSTHADAIWPATWRLQLCLAALYSGLGDPVRARTAARLGHDAAARASSDIGQQRACELLARLARHGSEASRGLKPRRAAG